MSTMHPAIEVLERHGLTRDEDSQLVSEYEEEKAAPLFEQLYEAVLQTQFEDNESSSDESDKFSFLASPSLRGEADCGCYGCRLQKLDTLGRYAALYATKIILPLPLPLHGGIVPLGGFLSHSVLALLRLRPLIESGIVLPVAMNSLDCEHTIDRSRQLLALAEELADDAARQMLDRFEIKFQLPEKSGFDKAAFRVTGPEDFLEHGSLWLIGGEPPNWRLKSWRYDSNGQVKLRGARKLDILRLLFRRTGLDSGFYLAHGRRRGVRYLASRFGETFLLDYLTQKDNEPLSASSEAVNEFMTHTLPLLGELPLSETHQDTQQRARLVCSLSPRAHASSERSRIKEGTCRQTRSEANV